MQLITLTTDGKTIRADLDRPFDLSIPLHFDGAQPSAFGAPAASAMPFRSRGFLGNVQNGGSCNCREYRLIPHCNGTHTECIGHVTRQAVNVNGIVKGGLEPALLLSIAVAAAEGSTEDTEPGPRRGDKLMTAQAIEAAWRRQDWPEMKIRALALRTLPNDTDKQSRKYANDAPPPYLTRQAVQLLTQRGIEHLLIDVPSLDRIEDNGLLTGHRLFWGLPPGSTDLAAATRPQATITELIYAPNEVADGRYLLDLQLAPFVADAAPSRPILYPILND